MAYTYPWASSLNETPTTITGYLKIWDFVEQRIIDGKDNKREVYCGEK